MSNIHIAAQNGELNMLKTEIGKGVNVNAEDNQGRTPLHVAAEKGHLAVVKILVENGADVNAKDNDGNTPLVYAAEKRHGEIVQYLIENKASVDEIQINRYRSENGNIDIVNILTQNRA